MELLPHQPEAVAFLAQRQWAFLADDPGLGKTLAAIVAADRIAAKRILVIAPAVARVNWVREFGRWSKRGRKVVTALSSRDALAALKTTDVLIISYDTARLLSRQLGKQVWDLLILDEAHMLKTPTAQRTRAVYGHGCAREPGSIVAAARRTWCLSGSPILAGVHEFWTHARALWTHGDERWPLTYTQWIDRYTVGFQSEFGWRVTGSQNTVELQAATEAFILRRKVEAVMPNLPELLVGETAIPLPEDAKDKLDQLLHGYPDLAATLRAAVEHAATRGDEHVAQARRILALAKLPGAVELLMQELDSGIDKIIVFGHHREPLQLLHKTLAAYQPVLVQGGLTPGQTQAAVDAFQNDPAVRVFIGNIQSAGTAITLTAAHHVRFLEADWTPQLNRQAMSRARRIGQKRTVFANFLVADHPLDEILSATLARKSRIVRDFEN